MEPQCSLQLGGPSTSQSEPSSSNPTPSNSRTGPSSSNPMPSASGTGPSSSNSMPSASGTGPSSSNPMPSASGTGPSSSNPIPVQRIPLIRIDERPGRGRAVIAARKITPGELVMTDIPHILWPASLSSIPALCSKCFIVLTSTLRYRCDSCKLAYFCSPRCLISSHPLLLCRALPPLFDTPAPCRPELLFLLATYNLRSDLLLQLLSLQSNSRFIPSRNLVKTLHNKLCSLISPDLTPPHFSREITYYLLSKEKNNSFPLLNPRDSHFGVFEDGGVRAYGLYFRASIFNNECLPNVCVFNYIDDPNRDNNYDLLFRAIKEIEQGTELCINYVPVNTTYRVRKQILMERYGFDCQCMRCIAESQWKENKEEEEHDEDDTEGIECKLEKQKWGQQEPDADDVFSPHDQYFARYVCECGGSLACFPAFDDRARLKLIECNRCSGVRKDWEA